MIAHIEEAFSSYQPLKIKQPFSRDVLGEHQSKEHLLLWEQGWGWLHALHTARPSGPTATYKSGGFWRKVLLHWNNSRCLWSTADCVLTGSPSPSVSLSGLRASQEAPMGFFCVIKHVCEDLSVVSRCEFA